MVNLMPLAATTEPPLSFARNEKVTMLGLMAERNKRSAPEEAVPRDTNAVSFGDLPNTMAWAPKPPQPF